MAFSRWKRIEYEIKVFKKIIYKFQRNEVFNKRNSFKLWVYETVKTLKRYDNTRTALKML
jgi:hypothetical protein